MPRDVRVALQDMLDAVGRIEKYTDGFKSGILQTDDKTLDAVVRNLEVLGEAAKLVSAEVRDKTPDVEWRKISGLRDILIHQYFGVDTAILSDVVENKIPPLKVALEVLLEDLVG